MQKAGAVLTSAQLDQRLSLLRAEFKEGLDTLRNELQKDVTELRGQVADLGAKVTEVSTEKIHSNHGEERVPTVSSGISELPEDAIEYEWDESMWDASLLLFVRRNNFRDVVILSFGLLLNLALQSVLFWVIVCNMLENAYDDDTVEEMLRWRIEEGHSGNEFNAKTGETLAARLCRGKLWSYEGAEYEDMYKYLYKPIAGQILSLLAIVLWLLTTMTEFRHTVEQAEAIVSLPCIAWNRQCIHPTEDGEFRVSGIYRGRKVAAFLFLVIPRLLILVGLSFAGCKYLAQTVTLSDIVLNAVALAFVMDIDESIAKFLLPNKLRRVLRHVQPMDCGRHRLVMGLTVVDLFRFAMTVGALTFAILFWLIPFAENVQGAATALCGGNLDFSYTGGAGGTPDLTIMPTVDNQPFQPFCDAQTNLTYQYKYYPGIRHGVPLSPDILTAQPETTFDLSDRRFNDLVKYAFSSADCVSGQLRSPPRSNEQEADFFEALFGRPKGEKGPPAEEDYSSGGCANVPDSLALRLPPTMERDRTFPNCPRFNTSRGAAACEEPRHPGACLWSWQAETCEGQSSPGLFFQSACRSDLWLECQTWEATFQERHPTRNCEIARRCTPDSPRCLEISGWLELTVGSASELLESAADLKRALANASDIFNISEPWAEASYELLFIKAGHQPLQAAPEVELMGVLDVTNRKPGTNPNSGKAWHVRATRDIANLSMYGMGSANNGGGSDGVEFQFPSISVPMGAHVLVSRDAPWLASYLGNCTGAFHAIISGHEPTGNGDDAVELFSSGAVIDTFGNPNVDGTGEAWEYTGSWAYKDTSGVWTGSPLFCATTADTTLASACPYPLCVPGVARCSTYRCPPGFSVKPNSSSIEAWDLHSCCDLQASCSSFTQPASCPSVCLWSGTACVEKVRSCTDAGSDCVMVLYSLQGVSDYLQIEDILGSGSALAERLNIRMGQVGSILSVRYSASWWMSRLPDAN